MTKAITPTESGLDAKATIRDLSTLTNIARVIAEGQIKYGPHRYHSRPCYKCIMGGQPTIIVDGRVSE